MVVAEAGPATILVVDDDALISMVGDDIPPGRDTAEVFQGQLDQVMTQHLTKASASTFTGPMYELFTLQRS